MDPATLAVTAISLVTGYLTRRRDDLVDRAGDGVIDRLGSLYQWIREKLRHEPSAQAAFAALEEEPADARRQGAAEFALTQLVERNTELAGQLAALLQAIEDESPGTLTQITESGAVAIGGDVRIEGTYVAGRDLTIGQQPGRQGAVPPDPRGGQ
jgi:hypothetical protein